MNEPDATTVPADRPRLSATELRRRLWHMTPGVLPFLLWPFSHRDPLSPTLYAIALTLAVGIALAIFLGYRRIQRTDADQERLAAVAGYVFSVLATLLVFPGAPEIAFAVLAILAFGDGAATFGGLLFGGPRLPWNPRKTWSGLASFVLAATPLATAAYWGESNNLEARPPHASPLTSLLIAGGAVLVAAVVESIPSRINDNIRVGVAASLTVAALHGWLIGWAGS